MEATIDPAQLRAFVAVVRSGSFTRAAGALSTRKSHLSRLVIRLEARLDAQLLHRTTRSVTVTELGPGGVRARGLHPRRPGGHRSLC
ncbi:helix-turn-helix domain-containing protein [Chenggangzhangella methanolivorans]|uniref:LysR family transcriptional regulator n=1 Tax=Chenggangzhangella methanolivorans TaxID=1437009 RepID=A0A9E6UN53_9HYPH|nr:LysR family transcriptional regulator [Chenggangzhangella methanolivorans]